MKDSRFLLILLLVGLAGFWLAGCATQVPDPIRVAPAWEPTPDEVRAAPARYQGAPVRWGGVVAGVENRVDHTLIQVVSRPLGHSGRPRDTDAGQGRFLARVPGFVEPAVFGVGRELTVRGRVVGVQLRPVGDYEYPYVLLDVDAYHLWPVREPVPDPYYYDPWRPGPFWYDPWYPYRHPFFRPWPR